MKAKKWMDYVTGPVGIMVLLVLILAERIYVMCTLGIDYNIANDDMSYIAAAFRFLETGALTDSAYYPNALSMPGMAWVISALLTVFGTEAPFWIAIKLLWGIMGTCTAYVTYKTVTMFAPKWCGLIAAGCYLAPNIAWMDNLVMTETPYFLCLTLTIYLTFVMENTNSKKVFAEYCVAFMAGFLLRPTIVVMPAFSLAYLFLRKVDPALLFKRMVIGIVVLMIFLVPWTIRNYIHFDHFVPLTAGNGNPMQEGTYQGFGYPADETLDYETNVELKWREENAAYLDEEGNVLDPAMEQFLNNKRLAIKAEYRMKVWWETNPVSMLLSYLIIKPGIMLIKTFYWQEILFTPALLLDGLRALNFFLCCATFLLAWKRKELWWELGFLAVVYWFYIYAIAMTYSFSRYGETLMSMRYVIGAIGIYFLWDEWQKRKQKQKNAP